MPAGIRAVPDWFSRADQRCGIAVVDRGATRDLVVLLVDNPGRQNRGRYRIGHGPAAAGVVNRAWSGVPTVASRVHLH